uniref:hypothetical protein n=1 Tax=Acetatifactor sp. TaxID=1872090 RepID=UPI004057454D
MVTFELVEDNSEVAKYEYFPEDKRQLSPGIIILSKKNRTVELFSAAEKEQGPMYAAHTMSKILKAYENGELLSSGMAVWY